MESQWYGAQVILVSNWSIVFNACLLLVLRATFIPCFVEAAAVAGLSYFIMGFPITVGLMLGFVLAAVSPAVIIPCLISIAER